MSDDDQTSRDRSWGEKNISAAVERQNKIPHATRFVCLTEGCDWYLLSQEVSGDWHNHIIAYQKEANQVYVRCPKCSHVFWIHPDADTIKMALETNPYWPK